MDHGNVRDWLGQQNGKEYYQNHGTWSYDMVLAEFVKFDLMRAPLHELHG